MSMLEVKDLQVYYGVIQALKGISFHVEQGEVIAQSMEIAESQHKSPTKGTRRYREETMG